jgi:hypothetical protein
MRTFRETIGCIFLLAISAAASNYTVKAGGGGNYTTIQACASAMSAGDTCTVYAGTYNESVTVSAGTTGNYKTITVNGSDVVNVYSFTLNSHTKLIGNCPTPNYPTSVPALGSCGFSLRTATPTTSPCVIVNNGSTDVHITSNVMMSCGSAGSSHMIDLQGTTGSSYVYIQGNTLSWGCGNSSAPNNCTAVEINSGNHILVENNDLSHLGLAIQTFAQYTVIRNNTIHDMNESECGSFSGNCHLDIIYAERSVQVASQLVQYQLWEGNTGNTVTGPDGKGLWTAADNPGGCGTLCFNVIGRYNILAHFGSAAAVQSSGFLNVKYYNNSIIDSGASSHGSPATSGPYLDDTSTGGASINNLYYYPFSITSSWGWYGYSLNSSGDAAGFTAGANLAFCSASPCAIQTLRNGTSAFAWTSDTPVIASNILTTTDPLANYSGEDFNLAAGSPALNAGTYLTTVAAGDSGSGTSLVVTDAGFFQDGLGLNTAGVQADCISVTTVSNHVCITAVNYSTNTLTMASGFSRSHGDPIWLYSKSDGTQVLTGSAPNIGATSVVNSSGNPAPPTGLSAIVN